MKKMDFDIHEFYLIDEATRWHEKVDPTWRKF
jgi:hypothetical protein